jgi:methionine-rich copper-binding protein CopC
LKPGSYAVRWGPAAKDEHPAFATFQFVVKAAR